MLTKNNTYILPSENPGVMGQFLLLDKMLNDAMGGPLPECNARTIRSALDIGCGPGGWAISLAKQYPYLTVLGIDISEVLITFAEAQARREGIKNAQFTVMDALERLPLRENSFDLVHLRAGTGWLPRDQWAAVIQECFRVTKPGGIIRLGECELAPSNKPACERWRQILAQLLYQSGYTFSLNGANLGMTAMLATFLVEAGCAPGNSHTYFLDSSFGAPYHAMQWQNGICFFQQIQPAIIQAHLASPEEVACLYARFQEEMRQEDFLGGIWWQTTWGEKP